jgi:hypothetical protein
VKSLLSSLGFKTPPGVGSGSQPVNSEILTTQVRNAEQRLVFLWLGPIGALACAAAFATQVDHVDAFDRVALPLLAALSLVSLVTGHDRRTGFQSAQRHTRHPNWCGEEFVLVLPGLPKRGGKALAEAARQDLYQHVFNQVGGLTASFGVAERVTGDDLVSVMRRADAALYAAKRQGRNGVRVAMEDGRLTRLDLPEQAEQNQSI